MHQKHPDLPMRSRQGPSSGPQPDTDAWATATLGPRIALADPDPLTRTLLAEYLRGKGFEVCASEDMAEPPPPVDAIIVALGDGSARASRPAWLAYTPNIPVIVLDRSSVFPGCAAALDFVPHARLSLPVPPRKLVATIRQALSLACIESADPQDASVQAYRFSGWTLHCHERQLESPEGHFTRLDKREFEVLRTFLRFPRQVLTRQQLIAVVWSAHAKVDNRTLDRPITRLRRHLGDDVRFPALIKTVIGIGYRLDADVDKSV
jgi:two-component system, OmpR family, response regulator